jgi:DNA-binding NarL/FixJ family response regulator
MAPDLERAAITDALLLGVRGVVPKSAPVDVLFKSIRAVISGQYWVDREPVADLVQSLQAYGVETPAARRERVSLTARERQIVSVLVAGCANKEIARRFNISERTVKHHVTNILHKLGLTSRLELAVFALRHPLRVFVRSGSTVAPPVP